MLLAGAIGVALVKKMKYAAFVGEYGVGAAWSMLYFIDINFFQGYEIGEFFATLVGFPGLGRFVVSLGILLSIPLGVLGAICGNCFMDLYRDIR